MEKDMEAYNVKESNNMKIEKLSNPKWRICCERKSTL